MEISKYHYLLFKQLLYKAAKPYFYIEFFSMLSRRDIMNTGLRLKAPPNKDSAFNLYLTHSLAKTVIHKNRPHHGYKLYALSGQFSSVSSNSIATVS